MSPSSIKKVGVIGTGVIGSSWIALFLANGLEVIVTDPDPNAPTKLSKFLADAWPSLERAGLAPGASTSNYEFVEEIDDYLGEIDFIQEARGHLQNSVECKCPYAHFFLLTVFFRMALRD